MHGFEKNFNGRGMSMKKILLIGELGNIIGSINECLVDDFKVQICSKEIANVQTMARIIKPDMVIICHIGAKEIGREIYGWLTASLSHIPVLGIVSYDTAELYREFYEKPQFNIMIRPIAKQALLAKCHKILNDDVYENEAEPDFVKDEKKKIMVVDDSAIMLRGMKQVLEKDYNVCLAKSGEKALKMIPVENPDLILLDYEMEGMDGKETFEIIKADEMMKNIPVVFLTGVSDRDRICSVLKSKPNGYILKPPDEEKILDCIENILRVEGI